MLFEVTHTTEFSYSQPVFLEPLTVRLRPRSDSWQRLLQFDMNADPQPAGLSAYTDLDGNVIDRMWFNGSHESLIITTSFVAETLRTNPFSFILDPDGQLLSTVYAEQVSAALDPYRYRVGSGDEVEQLAKSIAREVDGETVPISKHPDT